MVFPTQPEESLGGWRRSLEREEGRFEGVLLLVMYPKP